MAPKNTTRLIAKAIREGKYLSITYKNKSGEITLLANHFPNQPFSRFRQNGRIPLFQSLHQMQMFTIS